MQQKRETLGQIMRFGVVGAISTALHLSIYWLLQHFIHVNIAYSVGYFLSFLANYYLSARFTFREKTSTRNGLGFIGAHATNYLMHIVLFNFFLWVGLSRAIAPLAVLAIAVPLNFLMVRFVFKHFHRS